MGILLLRGFLLPSMVFLSVLTIIKLRTLVVGLCVLEWMPNSRILTMLGVKRTTLRIPIAVVEVFAAQEKKLTRCGHPLEKYPAVKGTVWGHHFLEKL